MTNNNQNPFYTPLPGLLGRIAYYVYAQAPRPVPEIAVAAAIALMSAICGRNYNVSRTGINTYLLVLARTGAGKEAMAGGIDRLIAAVMRTVPAAAEFVGPAEISSAQALTKYMANTSRSFVSIVGEIGLWLKILSSPYAASHHVGLRRMLLDLYNKSGEGKFLRPTIYSDKEKNTATIIAPAFTLLGESTPERYYEILTDSMITEGLLPRITHIEYAGERPALNPNHANAEPPHALVEELATLISHVLGQNSQNLVTHVRIDDNAQQILAAFDAECDRNINSATTEIKCELWNRAHMKAMKLAALLAIGCDPYNPTITADFAQWGIAVEIANVRNILTRFENGQVGQQSSSETAQQAKVRNVVNEWINKHWSELTRYRIGTERMKEDWVVPYSYVSKRLTNDAAFKDGKGGATATIKRAIDELCKGGELTKLPPVQVLERYGSRMELYAVTDSKRIEAEGRASNRSPGASDS